MRRTATITASSILFWLLAGLKTAQANDADMECGELTCHHGAICIQDAPNFESHRLPDGSVLDIHATSAQVHCVCNPGWTGLACDVEFRSCDGSDHKCYHGGECVLGLIDMYDNEQLYCNCDNAKDDEGNQYVGKYCEQKSISNCDPNDDARFCLNDGVCNEQFPLVGKSCICADGYQGEHCEYEKEDVPDCTLDCLNGGHCTLGTPSEDQLDNYAAYFDIESRANDLKQYCKCQDSWHGQFCEVESVPCGEGMCFHGAQCTESVVNGETLHHCDCRFANTGDESYAGRFCQYEATTYCDKGTGNGLNGHLFCVNGGTCQSDAYMGCSCPEGYRGFSCEYFVSEDLPPDSVNNATVPFDPVDETGCSLDCNGRGQCRDGIKDIDNQTVGNADHLAGDSSISSENFEHCVCQHGWTGLQCEHEAESCGGGEYHCFHGADCDTGGDEKKCDCSTAGSTELGTSTFAGEQCEHPATAICTKKGDTLTYNPSKGLSFCVNHGTCKKIVEEGEPHPGCNCDETQWTGPHCEIKIGAPGEVPVPSPSTPEENDDSGSRSAFEIMMILVVVFVVLPFAVFSGVQWYRNRSSRRRSMDRHALKIRQSSQRGGYRDEPNIKEQVNLSPRRRSTIEEEDEDDETAAIAASASSRDPFAGLVAPPPLNAAFSEDSKDNSGPQLYMGPPQDEDGHVLHSVEII